MEDLEGNDRFSSGRRAFRTVGSSAESAENEMTALTEQSKGGKHDADQSSVPSIGRWCPPHLIKLGNFRQAQKLRARAWPSVPPQKHPAVHLLPVLPEPAHMDTTHSNSCLDRTKQTRTQMPSVAEEYPRLMAMASGRKRRRDVNDANTNDLHLPGPLYEKLAQYQAATNNWNADGVFGGRPIQQQIQQQQQQQHLGGNFPRFPSSNNERLRYEFGFSHDIAASAEASRQNIDSVPRKIAPLPVSKRQRMFDDDDENDNAELGSSNGGTTSQHDSHQRRGSRSSTESRHTSHAAQNQADAAGNRPKTPSSLAPCHICHRRPTKKSDLDSFADCQGCGQRSCYICVRECQGWEKDGQPSGNGGINSTQQGQGQDGLDLSRSCTMDDVDDDRQRQSREEEEAKRAGQATRHNGWTGGGHRQMVCSRCCIEKGSEGDIVCLGCLSRMESV
ncbi:hypothetical protein CFIO01_09881 [Colletotrichum fioriniae PJ7]|uniref:Uncharacterized protein n=1 Tax=Colletotrichum fioriniae PJ7 TaxID=1445577 RepID=A0A010RHK4_9PEZI|nr:hypothetical protein CFIO01_09881 [Colletotrichum fioriniae PJ7]